MNVPGQAERYYEAAALQEDLEALTAGRADTTQEEGSYDPFRTLPLSPCRMAGVTIFGDTAPCRMTAVT